MSKTMFMITGIEKGVEFFELIIKQNPELKNILKTMEDMSSVVRKPCGKPLQKKLDKPGSANRSKIGLKKN